MIIVNITSTERESDDEELLISDIHVHLFLPSSTLVTLVSKFTLLCANLHTGVSMLSTTKYTRSSFANVRRLAFIRDSRKRINLETLILFRLKRSLALNDLRRIAFQLSTPHPFFVIREMSTRNGNCIPTEVVPFWLDSDQPLLCGSCRCVRIFLHIFLLFVSSVWEWITIMCWIIPSIVTAMMTQCMACIVGITTVRTRSSSTTTLWVSMNFKLTSL